MLIKVGERWWIAGAERLDCRRTEGWITENKRAGSQNSQKKNRGPQKELCTHRVNAAEIDAEIRSEVRPMGTSGISRIGGGLGSVLSREVGFWR